MMSAFGQNILKNTFNSMKQKIIMLCLCLVCTGLSTYAQWVVSDPTNLAQGIVNSTKQVVEAAKNGSTMLQSFQETVKIYEQGKRYYDALKSVSNLVRSARKVQQCILLVGEISDIYVDGYRRMVGDENFTPAELAAIAAGYARIETWHATTRARTSPYPCCGPPGSGTWRVCSHCTEPTNNVTGSRRWYTCFPLRTICIRFSGGFTTT